MTTNQNVVVLDKMEEENEEEKKYNWEKKFQPVWSELIDKQLSESENKEINEQRRKRKR